MSCRYALNRKISLYRMIAARKRKDGYAEQAEAFDRVARMLGWAPVLSAHERPWWWGSDSRRRSIGNPQDSPQPDKINRLPENEARP